ncbi:hypothetical protein [Galbibacter sp. BG1]
MRTVTIFFNDGDIVRTRMNGTTPEIQRSNRIGDRVNVGSGANDCYKTIEALTIEDLKP